jgi:hypothetical protein
MSTTFATPQIQAQDIVTTAHQVMPGDLLLNKDGQPVVLVTRAETRHTGRKVTRISGEWLVQRPRRSSPIFRQTVGAGSVALVRRGA